MTENENDRLREENRRRRIDQILATGMTREEMAEALQSAERSAHIWQTCTNAARKENDRLRELVRSMYDDLSHETFPPDWLAEYETELAELGIEVE